MGIGIIFGIVAGIIIRLLYIMQANEFYEDKHNFEIPDGPEEQKMLQDNQDTFGDIDSP